MPVRHPKGVATVAQLGGFDAIIDARSPCEFAEDHVPGALTCPVLDDAERAEVGTLYKQVSPFAARRIGAVRVARSIARHVEASFLDRPREWRPLVYCWRGGQRSGAFAHVLREIGWDAHKLEGGYKSWRRHVIDELARLPAAFRFVTVSGATGSGKSRVLESLDARGAQVLHLEDLAAHRGSVLGGLPDRPQPSQKAFETALMTRLSVLDARQPVFVEAESRKIGSLQVPDALLAAIRSAPCARIEAPAAARVAFLLGDYGHFVGNPVALSRQIDCLQGLQSSETLARWRQQVVSGDFPALVGELLEWHYDPLYRRSQQMNYTGHATASSFSADTLTPEGIDDLARRIADCFPATSAGTVGRSCG